jgi:hypothetical protein
LVLLDHKARLAHRVQKVIKVTRAIQVLLAQLEPQDRKVLLDRRVQKGTKEIQEKQVRLAQQAQLDRRVFKE